MTTKKQKIYNLFQKSVPEYVDGDYSRVKRRLVVCFAMVLSDRFLVPNHSWSINCQRSSQIPVWYSFAIFACKWKVLLGLGVNRITFKINLKKRVFYTINQKLFFQNPKLDRNQTKGPILNWAPNSHCPYSTRLFSFLRGIFHAVPPELGVHWFDIGWRGVVQIETFFGLFFL